MKLTIYQIDAFAEKVFSGNPAAVCILDAWIDDALMQQIAMENNLAETAFAVKKNDQYELRWFTPTVEVDLCGHATLATAFVLFHYYGVDASVVQFHSPRSGPLSVAREGGKLTLDFPTDELQEVEIPEILPEALQAIPLKAFKGKTDYLLIFPDQKSIENIVPDFAKIATLEEARGVIVTAPGNEVDFVSRFFAPQAGVNEDPVTGSAHTTLTPYWAITLGKNQLTARQLSVRGGNLQCEYLGERVKIGGKAVAYLRGEIEV